MPKEQRYKILMVDNGQIRDDGSYNELLAKNGDFAELVGRQRLDETAIVKTTLY